MTRVSKKNPQYGHPKTGDPEPGKANINRWSDKNIPADVGRVVSIYGRTRKKDPRRTTSDKTAEIRKKHLLAATKLLQSRNRGFRTLSQFTPRYAREMIQGWEAAGVSPPSQVQYFGSLRWFWELHGIKAGTIKEYATNPTDYVIHSAARVDKSVSAHVGNVDEFIEGLRVINERFALLCKLAHAAGLRRQEVLCVDPHGGDKGDYIIINLGAKGGRYREVSLNGLNREYFERAREAIDGLKRITKVGDRAGWPGNSLEANNNLLGDYCKKAKLTKNELGVTFHGFRKDYACDAYEIRSGEAAPLRGGMVINYHAQRDHQLFVSQQLGHNRPKITTAYYGSFAAMQKTAQSKYLRSWDMLKPHLDHVLRTLQAYDIDTIYIVGARASGNEATAATPFELQLPYGVDLSIGVEVCRTLSKYLTEAVGLTVSIGLNLVDDPKARAESMKYARQLFTTEADVAPQIDKDPRVAMPRPIQKGRRSDIHARAGADARADAEPQSKPNGDSPHSASPQSDNPEGDGTHGDRPRSDKRQ